MANKLYCLRAGPPMRWKAVLKSHEKGEGCICHVEWPADEKGDLIAQTKWQRREYRNEWIRWQRRKRKLSGKKAAPAFQAYLDKLRADHAAAEPKFTFVPPVYAHGTR